MLAKNSEYDIIITDMNDAGDGVCRIDGIAVFVKGGVTGDRCKVKIIKTAKSYAVASIVRVLAPSPYRTTPECPLKNCGGCVFQDITEEHELELKRNIVVAAFHREGIDITVGKTVKGSAFTAYRNKAQFPLARGVDGKCYYGFYAGRTHEVVKCKTCVINPPVFSRIADAVCRFADSKGISVYDETSGEGLLRHIYLRQAKSGILLVLVINGESLPSCESFIDMIKAGFSDVTGILLNINKAKTNVVLGDSFITLYGCDRLTDVLLGKRFYISAPSFYQVNHDCCEALYEKARDLLDVKTGDTVVDLYCGTGTVGLCAAVGAGRLIGIEIIDAAVNNARENAELNGISNAEFYTGDSALIGSLIPSAPDAVIVDPPRKGLSPEVTETLIRLSPDKILYISCAPDTLARDVKLLLDAGYTVGVATPFDMFPRTGHVETVCLLSKHHIEVNPNLDEMDLTASESKAAYEEIKAWVLEQTGMNVSHLYIAQVKRKYGINERENYNKPKSEESTQSQCPPDKEKAVAEALKHFGLLPMEDIYDNRNL